MPKYYLDSSENPSNLFEDAIEVFDDLTEAQDAAVGAASLRPTTIFYVREVIQSSRLVYQAEATLTIDSKVINEPAE